MDPVFQPPRTGPASIVPEPISTARHPTVVLLIEYGKGRYGEREVEDVAELARPQGRGTMRWVSVFGLEDADKLRQIAKTFRLHPLAVEDILNTRRRPRLKELGGQLFISLKALGYDTVKEKLRREHVSVVVGKRCVLTFQERLPDDFRPVREALQRNGGRGKKTGADYLAYLLIDAVVDHYYAVLERIGESIHRIDIELMGKPGPETMRQMQKLKNELIYLRRYLWPTREVLNRMHGREHRLVGRDTAIYLRDVYEHVVEMMDTADTYRDVLSNMVDIYMSMVSNRINDIMKVLTVIGTIFMPLTFIAGLWGMNFKSIPIADWEYGFTAIVGLSVLVSLSLLLYFRKKGWF
jgi:magnesium transporter